MRKLYTLFLIRDENRVLLGYKKRGFGKSKWNGFGGKVNPGEDVEDAAIRELYEECNVIVDKADVNKVGILKFDFVDLPDLLMEVHVFISTKFSGEVKESEEMLPKWFSMTDVPFSEMWADDRLWFPIIFERNQKFIGEFISEVKSNTIKSHKFTILESFNKI